MANGLRSAIVPALFGGLGVKPRSVSPTPPANWVPIQQVPNWLIEYLSPLGENIVDNGDAWVGTDHEITGVDPSIYLAVFTCTAPAEDMPASFPMRIRVPTFVDTITVPGSDQVIPTTIAVSGAGGATQFQNPDPPQTAYAGQPFEFTATPENIGGQDAQSEIFITWAAPGVVDGGPDGRISGTFRVQIFNPATEQYQNIQDAPGFWEWTGNQMVDLGSSFGFNRPLAEADFVLRHVIPEQRANILVRVVALAYEGAPDPVDPGTFGTSGRLTFTDSGVNTTVFDGPPVWPPVDFPGGPFVVNQPTINQPFEPPTSRRFTIQANECAFFNSAETGQAVSFEMSIEVNLP